MSYIKQNFASGQILKADQLNHIEEGIENVENKMPPENPSAHQQLVTDEEGNKKWVERLGGYCTIEDSTLFDYPEGTEHGFSSNAYMHYYSNSPFAGCELVVGETYVVTLAGTPYTTTAKYTETFGILLGNPAKVQAGDNTGESFAVCMLNYLESNHCLAVTTKFSTIPSLKIVGPLMKYNKIPPEFTEGHLFDGEGTFSSRSVNSNSSGEMSVALGNHTEASGSDSFAMGSNTKSKGDCSVSMGVQTIASGHHQIAMGKYNIEDTENKYAHIVGNGTYDARSNAHTLDWNGLGWFKGGLKVGGTSQDDESAIEVATKSDIELLSEKTPPSVVDPYQQLVTDADGNKRWVERIGYTDIETITILSEKTVTGKQVTVSISGALIDGENYTVKCNNTEYICQAYQDSPDMYGMCLGNLSMINKGDNTGEPFCFHTLHPSQVGFCMFDNAESHTISVVGPTAVNHVIPSEYMPVPIFEGEGDRSIVIGEESNVASGVGAIASGFSTEASGLYSNASGLMSQAKGDFSLAEGTYTIAKGSSQHAQGKYNIEDTEDKYAHIVGNGSSSRNRSNAHTLDWSGNAWFAGTIKLGGTGQDDEAAVEIATKGDIATLQSSIDTLNGTGEGSVKHTVAESVATIVASAPEDFDTLKEVADWIANDTLGTADLLQRVSTAENNITTHINNKENPHNVTLEQIGLTALTDADIDAICSVEIYNVSEVSY